MTTGEWVMLGVALVLSIVAGLLMAGETSLRVVSRARAEDMVERELSGAKRVVTICEDKAPYLNSALFLRVLCEMATTALVTIVVMHHVSALWGVLLFVIGVMTLVSFLAWGVAPRTLGRQRLETISRRAALPVSALTTLLGPVTQLLILLGNALTPGRGYADGPFASEAELREMVDMAEASDVIEDDERRMIHSVFELGDSIVKEVMVPRTDMVMIESTKTIRQAMSLALRSGFSRIPVIGEGVDDVVGVLYLKDLIRRVYDNASAQSTELVSSVMRSASWCPDSKPVDELLREMQVSRNHMVMVVDEFGGTAGLITIEDILEEIVGEIVDEYDDEVAPVTELVPGRYRVSSRLAVDELGELFGLDVDDDDVDTVGGLMAKELNMVPIAGSVVRWNGLELIAERSVGRRHQQRTVLVSRQDEDVDPVEAAAQLAVESAQRNS